MAHAQELADGALDTIAEQVGRLYPSLDNSVTQSQPPAELRETLPIWFLPTDAIDTGNDNLLELAQDTHRWHSQIWISGKPEAVARSIVLDKDVSDWSVKQVLKGDLAKTVDNAIRWVDAEIEVDRLVHILEIPAFSITALWLIDGQKSSVVIARLPGNLQSLRCLVEYSSQEFLEMLRQDPYAIGVRYKHYQPPRCRQNTPKRNTFNVLSIGAGIGGTIPAIVLSEIENKTGLPTAGNFDLITGTSIGGMIALGLSTRNDNGEPHYKARDFVEIYEKLKEDSPAKEDNLLRGPENVFDTYFHDATLGDVLEKTKTMVTYYDIEAGTPFFLKSWEPEHSIVEMKHAAWGTSATFTYFEPFRLSIGPKTRSLVDGAGFINTSASAYEEAKRIISEEEAFQHLKCSDIFVLSLGAGKLIPEIGSAEGGNWEKVKEISTSLDTIFNDERSIVDYQTLSFLGDNYIRLCPPLDQVGTYMDNASEDNTTSLRSLADKLIGSAEFKKVCDQLLRSA